MGKLEGKVCIITGASSGIGKEIAKSFSSEGAKLILAARRLEKLDELANELNKTIEKNINNNKSFDLQQYFFSFSHLH